MTARDFISDLQDNPDYKSGKLHYPPRGLGDIADLMDAYAAHIREECAKELGALQITFTPRGKLINRDDASRGY